MRTLESGYRRHGAAKTYPDPVQRSRSDSLLPFLPTFRKVSTSSTFAISGEDEDKSRTGFLIERWRAGFSRLINRA